MADWQTKYKGKKKGSGKRRGRPKSGWWGKKSKGFKLFGIKIF